MCVTMGVIVVTVIVSVSDNVTFFIDMRMAVRIAAAAGSTHGELLKQQNRVGCQSGRVNGKFQTRDLQFVSFDGH